MVCSKGNPTLGNVGLVGYKVTPPTHKAERLANNM